VTFGTAGAHGSDSPNNSEGPSRLDYVMARGMKVKKCGLVRGEPIPKGKRAMSSEEQELDLEVYVSDHPGALVDVGLA